MDEEFMKKMHEAGHLEYPGDQFITCGWMIRLMMSFWPIPVTEIMMLLGTDPYYYVNPDKSEKVKENRGRPCIVSEYGDWEYGGQDSTSRQRRRAGEEDLLLQCRNFIKAHNRNLSMKVFGDGLWVMCDYNRGISPVMESSGTLDIFRLPKFSYYFYKSQRDADIRLSNADSGPMVFIASYWTPKSPTDVIVFSNCDEVSLHLNGKLIERQKPDDDENSKYLAHPPYIFKISEFSEGELKATGNISGRAEAEHTVRTPGEPYDICISYDTEGCDLQAGNGDMIFVYARIIDKKGSLVPEYNGEVTFSISDGCSFIGPDTLNAEAGIATVLIKAGVCRDDSKVTVSAKTVYEGRVLKGKESIICV